MEIKKGAVAGSLESSDCMVTILPNLGQGITIDLDSDVEAMFGDSIRKTTTEALNELGVTDAKVQIRDRGALDCVIRARVQCVAFRAAGEHYDWAREDS